MSLRKSGMIHLPESLEEVTCVDSREVPPDMAGLKRKQVEKIWRDFEMLYLTGLYPAMSMCIRRSGQLVLHRSIGHRVGNGPEDDERTPKVLMDLDSPICLFSASKCITALLIHWLAEQGKLSLEDPIHQYLSQFKSTKVGELSILHLLSHRAGIPSLPRGIKGEALYERETMLLKISRLEPLWSEGKEVGYHAVTGGYILGAIVEKVSGKGLRQVVDEVIRQPLGFKYFNYGLAPSLREKMVLNYETGARLNFILDQVIQRLIGASVDAVVEASNNVKFLEAVIPAVNAFATADELATFFEVLCNKGVHNGRQIFSEQVVRQATSPVGKPQFDRMLLAPMHYSAGFMLGANPVGLWGVFSAKAFGHLGFTNNFGWADPDKNLSVAILTSGNPVVGTHIGRIGRLILDITRFCL